MATTTKPDTIDAALATAIADHAAPATVTSALRDVALINAADPGPAGTAWRVLADVLGQQLGLAPIAPAVVGPNQPGARVPPALPRGGNAGGIARAAGSAPTVAIPVPSTGAIGAQTGTRRR